MVPLAHLKSKIGPLLIYMPSDRHLYKAGFGVIKAASGRREVDVIAIGEWPRRIMDNQQDVVLNDSHGLVFETDKGVIEKIGILNAKHRK